MNGAFVGSAFLFPINAIFSMCKHHYELEFLIQSFNLATNTFTFTWTSLKRHSYLTLIQGPITKFRIECESILLFNDSSNLSSLKRDRIHWAMNAFEAGEFTLITLPLKIASSWLVDKTLLIQLKDTNGLAQVSVNTDVPDRFQSFILDKKARQLREPRGSRFARSHKIIPPFF